MQEEIKFSVAPECICAMLFCERMTAHEAIILTGHEVFSRSIGYGWSLEYGGSLIDPVKTDKEGTPLSTLVAFDAIYFPSSAHPKKTGQFKRGCILRELVKSFVAFRDPGTHPECSSSTYQRISTGNWGCGAFNGNHQLKFLIQWLSSTVACRPIVYYTFRDRSLANASEIVKAIHAKGINARDMYTLIINAALMYEGQERGGMNSVFDCVKVCLDEL